MPYRAFFATGGDTCYVVRVAATRPTVAPEQTARAASFPLPTALRAASRRACQSGRRLYSEDHLDGATYAANRSLAARVVVTHPGLSLGYTVLSALPDGSFIVLGASQSSTFRRRSSGRCPSSAIVIVRKAVEPGAIRSSCALPH